MGVSFENKPTIKFEKTDSKQPFKWKSKTVKIKTSIKGCYPIENYSLSLIIVERGGDFYFDENQKQTKYKYPKNNKPEFNVEFYTNETQRKWYSINLEIHIKEKRNSTFNDSDIPGDSETLNIE